MQGVVAGFGTIIAVIAVGYLLAAVRVLDAQAQQMLARLAFLVASPCLLLTVMSGTDLAGAFSGNLVATAVGVLAAGLPYLLIGRLVLHRSAAEVSIGTMCSAYCNAGNLGLPIAAYVLGDAAAIAPMLLLQLVVMQPLALTLLDADRTGRVSARRAILTPLTNPLTLGTLIGLALAAGDWTLPTVVNDPIELIGGMAVPGMLLAYGVSLRLGPLPGRGVPVSELGLVTGLKLVAQPLGAYLAGRALGLDDAALLALAVTAALPTAQNVFIIATRFDRQSLLARDTVFITTIGSVPAIFAITALLHR
ncbi:AEC family transporter [Nocardioides insulae]|uniref:AEC family transporter n=1 Tax=Nocardioides insulae TaxID=394734 RepID=UPI000417AB72|nr:AEC family transporter [Nocardioides insulae]